MRLRWRVIYMRYKKFQSTHPLRDATLEIKKPKSKRSLFQSTHPLRDATAKCLPRNSLPIISIHAPLTGCDIFWFCISTHVLNFNPRTPYGMRPTQETKDVITQIFQSTHPLRDATWVRR